MPDKKKNGKGKFHCPYYKSRPHNLSLKVLCSGAGYWSRCEYYETCAYEPVYTQSVTPLKEKTEDE